MSTRVGDRGRRRLIESCLRKIAGGPPQAARSVRGRSTERSARDLARLAGMRSRAASCQNDAYPTSPLCTSQSEPPPPLGPKHDSNCEEFFKECVERFGKALVVMCLAALIVCEFGGG